MNDKQNKVFEQFFLSIKRAASELSRYEFTAYTPEYQFVIDLEMCCIHYEQLKDIKNE